MSYASRSERVQREIDDAIAEGWTIETETPERVVLVKRGMGSLWVHLLLVVLTGWWSWGVVNLVYGGYEYFAHAQRRVVRESDACPECGASVATVANYCGNCGTALDESRSELSESRDEFGIGT
ncbi:zinc ribbon domain-containing protein [Halorussus litoreus]|uniref:zinc ribbon domain-containing protein n=1 Tax=Halorussus litoreus TaxID=1710536 RepID=UPI0013008739|nr:zinc ribbon domain-containing protein [Halorussus litoreus]